MVMLWLCIAQPYMYTLLFSVAPTSACKRSLSLSFSLFSTFPLIVWTHFQWVTVGSLVGPLAFRGKEWEPGVDVEFFAKNSRLLNENVV